MNNMNPLAIEKLADTKGVIAVTEFSRKGMLANFAGSFTEDEFSLMAGMCASITILIEMQCRLLADFTTDADWERCQGWVLWGADISLITMYDTVSVVRSQDVSFNALITETSAVSDRSYQQQD